MWALVSLLNNVVTLYFDGASVLIRNKSGANVVSIGYNSLSSAWGENAKKYSKCYGTNMEYFVPQAYSIKPTFMYGYVVSEYAPFYPNSGLPLDFINLYKTGTTYEYKPMAYSIPLGLSFKYLGAQGQPWTWTVNNLTQEDLQAALADELRGVKLGISVQDGRPAVAVQNK
jgi:hypothetical protein